jgi:hypothetical protein
MEEVELTVTRLLAVVWLILWRGIVGATVIGFLFGFVLGIVWFAAMRAALPPALGLGIGAVIGLGWYPFVIRMALKKKYKSFRIALVTPESSASAFG